MLHAESDPVAAEKAALRRAAAALRTGLAAAAPGAGDALARVLTGNLSVRPGEIVSGFWPMGAEIDVRPALAAFAARGAVTCLPVVESRGRPLAFRVWKAGDPLVAAGFGTSVPAPEAATVEPELLLVPLLAFDRRGMRLGYGGGFYDRTLAALAARHRVRAVGVAYAGQEVGRVPATATDVRLDAVATERGWIDCATETAEYAR